MRRDTTTIDHIVRRAKAADRSALGELYDALVSRVYRFVYFRVNRKEDAEDFTEQVFVKIFEKISQYDERGLPFEAWVFRIARNMIIDFYRAQKTPVLALDEALDVPDTNVSPETHTETVLQIEMVQKALPKLPDAYREMIILKFIEEYDNDEISVFLDKPVSHVRVLQSRALHKLKELLRV
jgi:RNA polymerase sigma-70 factor (ECF subfamily)